MTPDSVLGWCYWCVLRQARDEEVGALAPHPEKAVHEEEGCRASAVLILSWSKDERAFKALPNRTVIMRLAHRLGCLSRGAEVLLQEGEDLIPAVHRLFLPVVGPVVVEEAVAGVVIPVELIGLAVIS